MGESGVTVDNLILDLLEWIGRKERTYPETMDAWRTSCPKLPVWEDANDRGLVEILSADGGLLVRIAPAGWALLQKNRPHGYQEVRRLGGETSQPRDTQDPPTPPVTAF